MFFLFYFFWFLDLFHMFSFVLVYFHVISWDFLLFFLDGCCERPLWLAYPRNASSSSLDAPRSEASSKAKAKKAAKASGILWSI